MASRVPGDVPIMAMLRRFSAGCFFLMLMCAALCGAARGGQVLGAAEDRPVIRAVRLNPGEAVSVDGRLDEPAWTRAIPISTSNNSNPAAQLTATRAESETATTASEFFIPRVSTPPRIEDYISPDGSPVGALVTGFRQRRPGDGTPISQPTRVYLSYDSQNLYVVFVCEDDDAASIRANLAKREIIGDDDRVTVYLDTYDDNRRAYVFSSNALGVQQDGFFTEGQGQDRQFDTVWYSEGQLFEGGYAILMRIPFRSVRFSDESLGRWGIAFRRTIERDGEESYWPFITTRIQGFIVQFGSMTGLADVSGSRNIRLIPYANLAHARLLDRKQSAFVTEQDARVGLDAKFVFSDNVTLDLTVNPDFSQVESAASPREAGSQSRIHDAS